ncbi:MAG: siroheme synthase CysG [Candidatus Azotimanducaceae bacterium]
MEFLPIFVALREQRVVVAGGSSMAVAKIKLLLKTKAQLVVYAQEPVDALLHWHHDGLLTLHQRDLEAEDLKDARLVYSALPRAEDNARVAALARGAGVLINVADDMDQSDFITPAVVDRDPIVVAIGTEGTSPVLARSIKAKIEALLPVTLSALAQRAGQLRSRVKRLPEFSARLRFWRRFLDRAGVQAGSADFSSVRVPDEGQIEALLEDQSPEPSRNGDVTFVGAGPGDPSLLTLKARQALDRADVIIHDRLVSAEILDLARREATLLDVGKKGHGASTSQEKINALIKSSALAGNTVVRLKGGDPSVFGRLDEEIDTCVMSGIPWTVIPGVTAASAAAASIGRSLSQRGRNTEITLITGHAMGGFADQDWQRLAKDDQVAAVYMGRRAARFVQGRLLMHGADPETPVSGVSSASMTHQKVFETTLGKLAETLDADPGTEPLMLLYGLRPAPEAIPKILDGALEVQHGAS